jgi:hypothetical protein
MSRLLRSLPLVLAAVLAAGCSGSDETSPTTTGGDTETTPNASKITLLGGRTNSGPWVSSLSFQHGEDGVPVGFFVCAAWDESRSPEACDAAAGAKLPAGTILRLEQKPIGSAVESPDSPGWGTVGTSEQAELRVPLSDFVSGLDVRTATYRATLRRLEGGPPQATSNTLTVTWTE